MARTCASFRLNIARRERHPILGIRIGAPMFYFLLSKTVPKEPMLAAVSAYVVFESSATGFKEVKLNKFLLMFQTRTRKQWHFRNWTKTGKLFHGPPRSALMNCQPLQCFCFSIYQAIFVFSLETIAVEEETCYDNTGCSC